MKIRISDTAEQHGAGTDRWKNVVHLTKAEREYIRSGGTVLFISEYLSGGSHGTYWRKVIDHGRYGFVPRVPKDEEIKEAEKLIEQSYK